MTLTGLVVWGEAMAMILMLVILVVIVVVGGMAIMRSDRAS